MAKYRLSFDVDLVGLEVPTKPEMPVPQVAPTYIPAPRPNLEPGRYDQWSGYSPAPQYYVVPAPQTVTGGFAPAVQTVPSPTYTSWGGYAPASPSQVGQYAPSPSPQKAPPATPPATPELAYTVPPPMLPNETPGLVPERVDLQEEHMLALMENHLAEIQRLESAGHPAEKVLKEAKDKYNLEVEKAVVKEQVDALKDKVVKEGEKK